MKLLNFVGVWFDLKCLLRRQCKGTGFFKRVGRSSGFDLGEGCCLEAVGLEK